jgi:hypothetical protein
VDLKRKSEASIQVTGRQVHDPERNNIVAWEKGERFKKKGKCESWRERKREK